jgi:A/G-specific adenine glycosylase
LRRELVEKVRQRTGLGVKLGSHLKTIRHSVTRFRIALDCYEAEYVSGRDGTPAKTPMKWLSPRGLDRYPLSSTGRKLAKLAE